MENQAEQQTRKAACRDGERREALASADVRRKRGKLVFALILLVATLIVWFPSLFVGLQLADPDDHYHITAAALHHSARDILGWFTDGYWAYNHYEYRPLARLSALLLYFVWGPRPFGYHLFNVLVHFVAALLLGAVMVSAGAPKWAGRLAAVVWVVFPEAIMAVRWINGRQDVLCSAFVLAGVWFFLAWLKGRPRSYLVGCAACTVLAALSKESGAVTPLFLLLCAFALPTSRSWKQRLAAVALVCAALLPYIFLRLHAWPLREYASQSYMPVKPPAAAFQSVLGQLLMPAVRSLFVTWGSLGVLTFFATNFWELLAQQLAFWLGFIILFLRHRRLLMLGVGWKALFVLPAYNIYDSFFYMQNRYLPTLGTVWLVGIGAWAMGCWVFERLRRLERPQVRWAVVMMGYALMVRFYWIDGYNYCPLLRPKWPSWALIAQGGVPPIRAFCRQLRTTEVNNYQQITDPPNPSP